MANKSNIEFSDIQALVRFGHGRLREACFILLDIVDVSQARAWLSWAPVSTAEFTTPPPETALQIAFSADGLRAMNIDDAVLEGFSDEFIVGMTADESRSRRLGDIAENDPQHWQWGGAPESLPHLLIMLYAQTDKLDAWCEKIQNNEFKQAFKIRNQLQTNHIGNIEPFGFTDGISQPKIDWERTLTTNFHTRAQYSNLLSLGEILLGYPNEYGQYTSRPLIDSKNDAHAKILPVAEEDSALFDFGRNGSYVVMRQLHQDVPGFWQFINKETGANAAQREHLASAMVGRQRDGTPLVTGNKRSIQGIDKDGPEGKLNQFDFDDDPHGQQCPIGAHIRRSNPRTGDFPPGVTGIFSRFIRILGFKRNYPGDDLVASTRFHRILRRGRSYGSRLSPEDAINTDALQEERGLHFICLVANISRQFEFVQNAWTIGAKFAGVQNESDPLLGNRQPLASGEPTNYFSQADAHGPAHCTHDLPQFVTVRGGGYFFMPGIRALRYIAASSQVTSSAEQ